jgi:hypothetical protein
VSERRPLPVTAILATAMAVLGSVRWAEGLTSWTTGSVNLDEVMEGLYLLTLALAAVWDLAGWLGLGPLAAASGRAAAVALWLVLVVGAFAPFGTWFVGPMGALFIALALGGDRVLGPRRPAQKSAAPSASPQAVPPNVR